MGVVKNLMIKEKERDKAANTKNHNEDFVLDDTQRFSIAISKQRQEWLTKHTFEHRIRCALLELKAEGVKLIPDADKWLKLSSTKLQKNLAGARWITTDIEFENGVPLRGTALLAFGISKGKRTKTKYYEKRLKHLRAFIAITMYRYSIQFSFSKESDRVWLTV